MTEQQVGIVVNPNTRLLQRQPGMVDSLRELLPNTAPIITTEQAAGATQAIERLLNSGVDVIASCGGDGTMSSLVTAYARLTAGDADAPTPSFLTLRAGTWNRVARALGIRGTPVQVLRHALRALKRGRARVVELPTLRLSSALRPRPDFGFTALFGQGYDLVEDAQRHGAKRRDLARALLTTLRAERTPGSTRLAANIDGVASVVDLVHLTTLDPSLRRRRGIFVANGGASPLSTARGLAAASILPGVGRGRIANSVVLDLDGGYVLDGDLQPAATPYSVRVDVGASARLFVP